MWIGIVIAALVLGGAGITATAAERIAPDVRAGSLDVSGMSLERARAELEREGSDVAKATVTIQIGAKRWVTTHADLGISLDVPTTLKSAYSVGRLESGAIDIKT